MHGVGREVLDIFLMIDKKWYSQRGGLIFEARSTIFRLLG